MTLEEARQRIGSGVVYRAYPGAPGEDGEITSVNDTYVFVRYVGDRQPKATHPNDIESLVTVSTRIES